jgi:hypothetical protein
VSKERVLAGREPSRAGPVGGPSGPPGTPILDPVPQFAGCDIAEILRDSVGQASRESPSVPVEIHAPQTLPAVGDREALGGIVRILVDNACRRTDPGLGVMVKANRADEGIAVHVFERGSGTDTDDASLDVARGLVALHGGVLWSEPLPSGGAKFSFVIPREPPALEGLERESAIRSLGLLAELGRSRHPAPREDDREAEEAMLGFLDPGAHEPEAILDVTDIHHITAVDHGSVDTASPAPVIPWDGPEAGPQAETPAEAEAGAAVAPAESAPTEAELPTAVEIDGPTGETELAGRRAERPGPGRRPKPRRGRWGWRRQPGVPSSVEDQPVSDVGSPPTPDVPDPSADPTTNADPADLPMEGPRDRPAADTPGHVETEAEDFQSPEEEEPAALVEIPEVEETEQVPAPEAAPARSTPRSARGVPMPFVPDPLHPATQMLRALGLDHAERGH